MEQTHENKSVRLAHYEMIAWKLSQLSDQDLLELVARASPEGTSIGGTSAILEIAGTRIFVKKVPLTEIEQRPENRLSTRNIFNLPPYFQYGIGSVGFGAWRELAAHSMANQWVVSGDCENFPLMYHWRQLPKEKYEVPSSEALKDLDREVEYWGGSEEIRGRLEARLSATAEVVLFLEYFPENLRTWLPRQFVKEDCTSEAACSMVDSDLNTVTTFMRSCSFLHFDAHFANILTDGRRLYFCDFGLAISTHFDLSDAERCFFETHRSYDRCYTAAHLVGAILSDYFGANSYRPILNEAAVGKVLPLPPAISRIVKSNAPIALATEHFFEQLKSEGKTTPFPNIEFEQLLAELDCEEVPLQGGRMTDGVVRIGNTVRRPIGPHSSFVHQLLIRLQKSGFNACPKFLGVDDKNREILSFVPGTVPGDLDVFPDEVLKAAGALLRRLHDATVMTGLQGGEEVVVHEDFTPCNTVFVDGLPSAIIDFDSAKPGSRRWDLAYSLWLWLDLGNEDITPEKQAKRIKIFCDGYGFRPDVALIDDIIAWQKREVEGQVQDAIKHNLDPENHPPVIWTKACLQWTECNQLALFKAIEITCLIIGDRDFHMSFF